MPEEKAPFPFNMVERMMPMYPIIAVMGWAFVLIALLVGFLSLGPAQTAFFADAKAVREGAAVGSSFVNANVTRHVIEAWVPSFKFFGLGLGLLAIVMALGIIAKSLQKMGFVISHHIPAGIRPTMPKPPKRVRVFQMSAMMGLMIMLAAMIIGFVLAAGVVPAYWNHGIIAELNPAQPGSTLLTQAGTIFSYAKWLNPLRMVGMALLFTAISIALTVIIGTLKVQAELLIGFYNRQTGQA